MGKGKRRGSPRAPKGAPPISASPSTVAKPGKGYLKSLLTGFTSLVIGALIGYFLGQASPDLRVVNFDGDLVHYGRDDSTRMVVADIAGKVHLKNRSFVGGGFANHIEFTPEGFTALQVQILDLDRTPIGRFGSRHIMYRVRIWVRYADMVTPPRPFRYTMRLRDGSGAAIRFLNRDEAFAATSSFEVKLGGPLGATNYPRSP